MRVLRKHFRLMKKFFLMIRQSNHTHTHAIRTKINPSVQMRKQLDDQTPNRRQVAEGRNHNQRKKSRLVDEHTAGKKTKFKKIIFTNRKEFGSNCWLTARPDWLARLRIAFYELICSCRVLLNTHTRMNCVNWKLQTDNPIGGARGKVRGTHRARVGRISWWLSEDAIRS